VDKNERLAAAGSLLSTAVGINPNHHVFTNLLPGGVKTIS